MPVEKESDVRIGGEAGNKDESICHAWAYVPGLEIKFVSAHARHLHIANDGVVLVDLDLGERFLTVERKIDKKIFVRQNPLQGGSKLLVVIHHENGFQFESIAAGPRFHGRQRSISSHGAILRLETVNPDTLHVERDSHSYFHLRIFYSREHRDSEG